MDKLLSSSLLCLPVPTPPNSLPIRIYAIEREAIAKQILARGKE